LRPYLKISILVLAYYNKSFFGSVCTVPKWFDRNLFRLRGPLLGVDTSVDVLIKGEWFKPAQTLTRRLIPPDPLRHPDPPQKRKTRAEIVHHPLMGGILGATPERCQKCTNPCRSVSLNVSVSESVSVCADIPEHSFRMYGYLYIRRPTSHPSARGIHIHHLVIHPSVRPFNCTAEKYHRIYV